MTTDQKVTGLNPVGVTSSREIVIIITISFFVYYVAILL